jgi:hypothetical protein
MKKKLIEGEHFYYNEQGYMVLTAKYHLENGTCCGNGCLNCPYDHIKVPEPKRSELRAALALSTVTDQHKDQ